MAETWGLGPAFWGGDVVPLQRYLVPLISAADDFTWSLESGGRSSGVRSGGFRGQACFCDLLRPT